ncbi:MAG: prepilin-type N-terminal cleavage/methylation domain-containing protein [Anaerocolumna aminovalerica]|uniref:type IV pilus modification PilV family protein n=1 Tax=Anaerocolumna aminovalerica TaxID=1527 RepID=UPI00290F1091|nr:prepilin-type N-terminal cleavage/methylation domain-containing protein [Anaerocolumna aminovalerica]MDU6265976.1 prepilin-type N-terminal cleavage/methylation domain-containing protein [Anaerocolumna aminovalerica]
MEGMMGGERKKLFQIENKGFSLVELLVGIAIIALVFGPILKNFLASARVNVKARKVQQETILAQNIVEDVKAKTILEIASTYNDNTIVHADKTIYTKKLVQDGKNKYDVQITIDKDVYKDVNSDGDPIGYNNYKMPVINDINEMKNVIATENRETYMAISLLYNNYRWYREQTKTDTGYTVGEYSEDDIRMNLNRDIQVNIKNLNGNIEVRVEAVYTCGAVPGSGSESYVFKERDYNSDMNGIYVFYKPIIHDKVTIHKDSTITETIDLFLVSQDISYGIILDNPDFIPVYSNVSLTSPLVKKETKTRLYDVTIKLFSAGVDYDTAAPCVTFYTTKEE